MNKPSNTYNSITTYILRLIIKNMSPTTNPIKRKKFNTLFNTYKLENEKTVVFGAGEGIRTLDFNLGKVALYP